MFPTATAPLPSSSLPRVVHPLSMSLPLSSSPPQLDQQIDQLLRSPQQTKTAITQLLEGGNGNSVDTLVKGRLIKSPASAFAEVAEIKMIVTQLLLTPGSSSNAATLAALLGAANLENGSSSSNNNNGMVNGGQNGTASRKRSAHYAAPSVPPQPECPVALRPAISTCNLGSPFVNTWPNGWGSLFSTLRTSPTLPNGQNGDVQSAVDNKQWSSPSSVESGANKTDSSAGESNIDPVGMDGSESSSTSSTCTQAMMSSPPLHAQSFGSEVLALAAAAAAQNAATTMGQAFDMKPLIAVSQANHTHTNGFSPVERKPRKQISDDYVKLIRQQHDMSGKKISDIQIPVPEALECDPTFTAVSEQQIVQQIVQTKKFEEMNAKEATTQLCKKLAEKRVFGPRLMAQTTVAGPNHSTYNNLPDEGIIYIQHVCRQVLKDKLSSEEEFWDVFREAMRKLAARCRRVRHAKKTKSMKENVISLSQTHDPMSFIKREPIHEWAEGVRMRALNAASPSLPMHSDLTSQVVSSLPLKFELPAPTPFEA